MCVCGIGEYADDIAYVSDMQHDKKKKSHISIFQLKSFNAQLSVDYPAYITVICQHR